MSSDTASRSTADVEIDQEDSERHPDAPEAPTIVDIGGGSNPIPRSINVDLRDLPEVDHVAEASDLPFEDGSVDELHCHSVIPHVDDLNAMMAEFARVLAPGGKLIVSATHAHCTGIVQDPDHNHWSWTARTPEWYDREHEFAYYSEADLELDDVTVNAWARPDTQWIRPVAFLFGLVIDAVSNETADELLKLPFAAGRVKAVYRKPDGGDDDD